MGENTKQKWVPKLVKWVRISENGENLVKINEKIMRKWVVIDLFIQHYQKMQYFMQKTWKPWLVYVLHVPFDGFLI